jgi:hypothetical protein
MLEKVEQMNGDFRVVQVTAMVNSVLGRAFRKVTGGKIYWTEVQFLRRQPS